MTSNRYVVVRSDHLTGQTDVLGGLTFATVDDTAEFISWQARLPGCEITVCELVPVDTGRDERHRRAIERGAVVDRARERRDAAAEGRRADRDGVTS